MSSDFFFLTNECVELAPFINVLRSLARKKEDTQAHKVKQMKIGRQVSTTKYKLILKQKGFLKYKYFEF